MPRTELLGAFFVHIDHRALPLSGTFCRQSSLETEWCLNTTPHILKGSFTAIHSFVVKAEMKQRKASTLTLNLQESGACRQTLITAQASCPAPLSAVPGEGTGLGCGTD